MDDRWFGNAFQIFEATDENDLEVVMVVLCGGTHIEKDEEEQSARTGTYLGMRDERLDGCWNLSTLKVTVAILKLILWRTGSQCKSERTGVMWQNRGFCAITRASVFWARWRGVGFEMDVPARRELQNSSREPTIAAAMVFEASVVREARMWCQAQMEISLACFSHLLIKGHLWVKVNTQIRDWRLKLDRRASNRDHSNRVSWSSKRFGSDVEKSNGFWLGWV